MLCPCKKATKNGQKKATAGLMVSRNAKFGIVIDGWKKNSEHFIAIFAVYEKDANPYGPHLAMAPLVNVD